MKTNEVRVKGLLAVCVVACLSVGSAAQFSDQQKTEAGRTANGTVRDPATIAAMMGCYRNRDLATIIPGLPNREGAAERCIRDIKRALAEIRAFAYDLALRLRETSQLL